MSRYHYETYGSSGGSEEGDPDSPPPSPPHRRRTTEVTAAAERSPPPSSPEFGSSFDAELSASLQQLSLGSAPRRRTALPGPPDDTASWDDDLFERMEGLAIFRDEIDYDELWPPSPPLWEPAEAAAPAAAGSRAASERQPQPAFLAFTAQFSYEVPPGPRPEQLLAARFRGLLPPWKCKEALKTCRGDHFAAHRYLQEALALLLARSTPLSPDQSHDHVQRSWDKERDTEERQLAALRAQQQQLQQQQQQALRRREPAQAAAAQRQLEELQRQCNAINASTSRAILQHVNVYSFGTETVDLHGQRPAEARAAVVQAVQHNTRHWPAYRGGTFVVLFITGRGNHSTPSRQGQQGSHGQRGQQGRHGGRGHRGSGGGRGRHGRAGGRGHSQRSRHSQHHHGHHSHSDWPAGALDVSVVKRAVRAELQQQGVRYTELPDGFCAFFTAPSTTV